MKDTQKTVIFIVLIMVAIGAMGLFLNAMGNSQIAILKKLAKDITAGYGV